MIERTKRGHSPISMATAVGVHSAETGGLAKVLFFFLLLHARIYCKHYTCAECTVSAIVRYWIMVLERARTIYHSTTILPPRHRP